MENHKITITFNKKARHFEISDHPHHAGERCKYKVFENDVFVASFVPDKHYFIHPCQNPAELDEELLHVIARRIEADLPHPLSKQINRNS